MYPHNQDNSTHTIIENLVRYNLLEWANQFYQSKKIEGVSWFRLTFTPSHVDTIQGEVLDMPRVI